METKRKQRVIVDADIHQSLANREELLPFLPKAWHQEWLQMGVLYAHYYSLVGAYRKDAYPPQGGAPGSDPQWVIRQLLDENGIDYGILTSDAINVAVQFNPDYANVVASAYNEWTAAKWLTADRRFKGSIVINCNDPEAAVQEIEKWGNHPDMVQIVMPSGSRTLYGQRCFHPIYAAAEKHALPIAIHPTAEGRGIATPATPSGYPTRYMEWHAGLCLSYIAHINSWICEGVFEKYPGLRIVGLEAGISWLPFVMWNLDSHYKALRASVPWLKRLPSSYIVEHLFVSTQPMEEPEKPDYFAQILEMMHAADTLIYSSDYPHWDFDAVRTVEVALPRHLRDAVMGETALKLYGLSRPPGKGGALDG